MPEEIGPNPAVYARRSTEEQSDQHQLDDVKRWLDYQGLDMGDVEVFVETASGASGDRAEFRALTSAVENGEVSDVVVWEISRIARNGLLAQEFFEACEDAGVTIHVTDGAVRRVEPDGHGRLVADIVAAVAAEERRRLIERTQSGQRRARQEGKWLGQVPAGFVRSEDGYLKPNLDPNYDAGETGYFDIIDALEQLDNGGSYRAVAGDDGIPNITRQTLSTIHQNEERRSWYLDGEPEDDRIAEALLDEVGTATKTRAAKDKMGAVETELRDTCDECGADSRKFRSINNDQIKICTACGNRWGDGVAT